MNRATFVLMSFCALASFAASNDPVKTDAGQVSGIAGATPDMRIYKGIPFAAPPVGDLRWKAPQPPAHWEGVRKAEDFGPVCMQANNPKASEDCLYLNVWTAAKAANEKRPVMVWIYGGGYNTGSGSQPDYDGEALAAKGAVIVTLNYRLGAFGFFSHPDLTKESDRRAAANFGVMDSIQALQWVQKNIAAFGGDPKRVTIFGESAGAGLIANLMAAPSAKGLFQRAVGESSSWTTATVNHLQTLSEAEQNGVKFADTLGVKSLAELRAKPAADILKTGRGPGPIVDGYLIPEDTGTVFMRGKQIDVPVLVGSNRDESFAQAPKSLDQYVENAKKRYGDMADTFLKLYPASNDEQAKDSAFLAGRDEMAFVMRNWARLETKTGHNKAYVYFFTHQPPVQGASKGPFAPNAHGSATHVSEVQYVFDHLRGDRGWTDTDKQVADTMSTYWVNFAANGDPNGKGLAKWPAYDDKKGKDPMVFGDKAEAGPGALSDAQMAFFTAYFEKQTPAK